MSVHGGKLGAPGVPGHMDRQPLGSIALGQHVHTTRTQLVQHALKRRFVARNDAGRHDDRVAQAKVGKSPVAASGEPGQRRVLLTLGAGADERHFAAVEATQMRGFAQHVRKIRNPQAFRGRGMGPQRPTRQRDPAAGAEGRITGRPRPRHVGAEAADHHRTRTACEQSPERLPHLRFRGDGHVTFGVGAVAHHRQQTGIAQRPDRRDVGGQADQRVGIQLEVTGVQHVSGSREDGQGDRFRDRVRHPDGTYGECPGSEAPADGKGSDVGFVQGTGLVEAPGNCRRGERRRPDRATDRPGKDMLDGADMVLVSVRHHQRIDATDDAEQGFGVGDEGVHTGGVVLPGKGDACVDQDPASVMAIQSPVHADAAKAANRHDEYLRRAGAREPLQVPQREVNEWGIPRRVVRRAVLGCAGYARQPGARPD